MEVEAVKSGCFQSLAIESNDTLHMVLKNNRTEPHPPQKYLQTIMGNERTLAMRYTTADQIDDATARRAAPDFGLTPRALAFARLFAEAKLRDPTECARQAGYSRRCRRGAHVRAYELLRDPRVIRAVLFFSAKVFNTARADAIRHLSRLDTIEGRYWTCWDRAAFNRLTATLQRLETHTERLEKIYTREVYIRERDFLVL